MAFCEEQNHLYKVINVIIIMQKLHFKNYTSKKLNSVILENGIRYFRKLKFGMLKHATPL